ncbi:MAG: PQQ-binding-like beta-propeller repeat protein [Spirochaetes bacterium]|nr:PQQ-binding-like beta-propeller repeat protein [Spirochaetota bacterium]
MRRPSPLLLMGLAAALGALGLLFVLNARAPQSVVLRVPKEKESLNRELLQRPGASVKIEGIFRKGTGAPSSLGGAWPMFRGPDGDNIAKDGVRLADAWGPGGPRILWTVDLGEGYAGPAVKDGRVYLLDYDEAERADALRCLSFADGKEIWRRSYKLDIKRNHGISRTVPALVGRHVVSLGPKCHVLCVDALTGDFAWGLDLPKEQGTKIPLWYAGQCPLGDGPSVVLAPGGRDLLIGVDAATGRVLWRTPNPDDWGMSHSSVVAMTLQGKRQYVYCALGGVVGVSAEASDRGRLLWKCNAWNLSVVAPSPVAVGPDRLYVTAGYGGGGAMITVDAAFGARIAFKTDKEVFACEQQTPILVDGLLYTVLPADAGPRKQEFACLRLDGTQVWSSGREERFGLGPFLYADGKFFILDDAGTLTMAKADGKGYRRLGKAKLLSGRDAWGPLALVGGRMLLRDLKRLACIDLAGRP